MTSGYDSDQDYNGTVWQRLSNVWQAETNDYKLTYISTTITFAAGQSQRIRLPGEVLDQSSGNCIELTLLYASVVEALGMQSAIVIVPGHAYVAVRVDDTNDSYYFIETTIIGRSTFDEALKTASPSGGLPSRTSPTRRRTTAGSTSSTPARTASLRFPGASPATRQAQDLASSAPRQAKERFARSASRARQSSASSRAGGQAGRWRLRTAARARSAWARCTRPWPACCRKSRSNDSGPPLGMDAEAGAVRRRGPLPQVQIGQPQRAEQRQQHLGVVADVVEPGRPGVLVVAEQHRLVLGQHPAVAGRGHAAPNPSMWPSSSTTDHSSSAGRSRRSSPAVFDQLAPGLELGLLDLERIVGAERVEHGFAVGVGLLR